MSELAQDQKEHLDLLLQAKAECQQKIEQFGKRESLRGADTSDVASEVEAQHINEARRTHEVKRMKRINYAIAHIEDFPYCLECGCEIPKKRLEFDITSTECVDCKQLSETKQKQFA